MASGKSSYLQRKTLDLYLGASPVVVPPVLYVALSLAQWSADATGAAMTEVALSGAYARVAVANDAAHWPAATGTSPAATSNAQPVAFVTATTDWGLTKSFYLLDALTAGNVFYGGDLDTAVTIVTGYAPVFDIGTLIVEES